MNADEIEDKYITIKRVDGKWKAILTIGVQSFSVCQVESKKTARWFAKMLAVALERLIKLERK